MDIKEFRTKYPQYNDMSDMDLAKKFHDKYYSDMPFETFSQKFGMTQQQPQTSKPDLTPEWAGKHPNLYGMAGAAKETLSPIVEGLGLVGGGMAGAAGGPLGAAVGAGLGFAGAKRLTNAADIALGNTPPETAGQAALNTAKDVASGASAEVGGQLLGAGTSAILKKMTPIARAAYESALKPVPSMPANMREKVITIGLDNAVKGLPYRPNEKSVLELGKNITNLVDTADNIVVKGSKAGDVIPVKSLADALDEVKSSFSTGPFPKGDIAKIESLEKEFINSKGFLPKAKVDELAVLKKQFEGQSGGIGLSAENKKTWKAMEDAFTRDNKVLKVDDALTMKKRIYKIAEKYYNQGQAAIVPAKVESEKAVAAAIKKELESLFPATGPINREASRQIAFGKVLERAANRTGNKELFTMFDFLGGAAGGALTGAPGAVEGAALVRAARGGQAKALFAKTIMKAQIPETVKKQLLLQVAKYGMAETAPAISDNITSFFNALSKAKPMDNIQETQKNRISDALRGNQ